MTNEHSKLVNDILILLSKRTDCRVWKNSTGVAKSFDGDRVIKYGLVGSSDICGIIIGGQAIFIECKTGAAVLGEKQKYFKAMIQSLGGNYFVARVPEDADRWVESLCK